MGLEGTLESFGIAEIFQLISTQNKTGVLEIEIEAGRQPARIRFLNGQLLDAYPEGNSPSIVIGSMLLNAGVITEKQLDYALGIQKKNLRRIGDILIRMGAVRTNELQEMLALQRREMAHSLLRLKRGRYVFIPQDVEFEEGVDTLLNVDAILMEGSRQIDEWPAILKKIPSEGRVFKRVDGQSPLRELTEEEARVYGLVDGHLTVRQVVDRSRLGEFPGWDALATLYDEGLITLAEKKMATKPQPKKDQVKKKESFVALDAGLAAAVLLVGMILLFVQLAPGDTRRMHVGDALDAQAAARQKLLDRATFWSHRTMEFIPPK